MSQKNFLERLIINLEKAEIPYMISGSPGSSFHGEPRESESELEFRDVLGIIMVQWENLNREYLQKWARELGVESLLDDIINKAENL